MDSHHSVSMLKTIEFYTFNGQSVWEVYLRKAVFENCSVPWSLFPQYSVRYTSPQSLTPVNMPLTYHSNNFSPSIISISSILLTNCHPKLYLFSSDPLGPEVHWSHHFPLSITLIISSLPSLCGLSPCSSIIVILSRIILNFSAPLLYSLGKKIYYL